MYIYKQMFKKYGTILFHFRFQILIKRLTEMLCSIIFFLSVHALSCLWGKLLSILKESYNLKAYSLVHIFTLLSFNKLYGTGKLVYTEQHTYYIFTKRFKKNSQYFHCFCWKCHLIISKYVFQKSTSAFTQMSQSMLYFIAF